MVTPGTGRATAATITASLAIALLAGCSGTTSEHSTESEGAAARDAAPRAPGGENADGRAEAGAPAEEGGASEDGSDVTNLAVENQKRTVIYTADLDVEVSDVQEAVSEAKDLVLGVGGHVGSENIGTEAGDAPRASLRLRVPQEHYEDILEDLADLGQRKSLDREAVDVTEEVADVDSRVKSAKASLKRLRALLDEADDVQDILDVEREIDNRQAELESLQARQAALADQTSLGTVNLELTPPPGKVEEDDTGSLGFLGGLKEGWAAFTTLLDDLAAAAGWALPFLITVLVLASPVVLWWRRSRRANSASAAQALPTGPQREEESGASDGAVEGTATGASSTTDEEGKDIPDANRS
ncbi:hypothetical protein GCM10009799_13020 [Nocardiopsis rhodophaea]|uniref:DUF4349 domain-containing protein n=1 Tax=Nocardiopsis rhodophaea TaxID=280238 RepID=A0ABN2SLL8_9ACTN